MILALGILLSRIPADWLAFVASGILQTAGADSLIPGIGGLGIGGAVALIVMQWKRADDLRHTAEMERLGNRYIELSEKHAEGLAAVARALAEIKTAIEQGRSERELEKRLDKIVAKLESQPGSTDSGSRRGTS